MLENLTNFLKKFAKKQDTNVTSKDTAKERLHLVLMQDRANVSADFLDLMKQEIIEVIKKYIEVDEEAIDVRLTNKENEDGTNGAPALYANIPIVTIKNDVKKVEKQKSMEKAEKVEDIKETEEVSKTTSQINDKNNDKIEKKEQQTKQKEESKSVEKKSENQKANTEDKKTEEKDKPEKSKSEEKKAKE